MKQENKTELYTSPEVEVVEIKAMQVMCTSPSNGTPEQYGNGEWQW